MTRRFDVAIVGGGPVGATLAAGLRGWPFSVAQIDPKPHGGEGADARSLALSYGSARLYRTLGLWEEVGCGATPITEVHVSRRGGLGFVRIRAAECGVDALGHVISARSLERGLGRILDKGAGTGGAGFERICAAVDAVEIRRRDALVSGRGPEGNVTVAARLVVGADGAGSVVRRMAGLPLRVHRSDHVAVAGELAAERPPRGRAFERFTERGPLALLPLGEDRCGFVWAVRETVADGEDLEPSRFGAELAEAFGSRLGELHGVDVRVRHPLRVCHAPRIVAPRTVLVGNAANTLHPVGAQGFNLGLRDVEALVGRLGEASAAGADPASVLDRYAAARRADHSMARLLTAGLLRIFGSGSRIPFAPALGAAGLLAFDRLGPVKRGFTNLAMGTSRPWPGGGHRARTQVHLGGDGGRVHAD